MKLVKVIPLSRGVNKEYLSYFSNQEITPGSMVEIPVRKKVVNALVLSSEKVSLSKGELKASSYQIKKIGKIKIKNFFLPQYLTASHEAAKYFATTTGAIIGATSSKVFLDESSKLKNFTKINNEKLSSAEKLVFQASQEDRLASYKGLVRSEFAKKSSVFFCLPTIQNIEKNVEFLQKGIEDYTFILHSKMTKKQLVETFNKIMTEKHPVLIIATGSFLSIPRNDISTIILEKENSRSYKTLNKPSLDIRTFAEVLSSHLGIKLILGDTFLRPETIWRYRHGEFSEFSPLKFRFLSAVKQEIIDMKKYKADNNQKFKIFSDESKKIITDGKKNNEKTFIFSLRKGLFPTTVCGDCGHILFCQNCETPLVLYGTKKKKTSSIINIFRCNKCGEERTSAERCSNCKSWKLIPLGIGVENIEEEFKKEFPDIKIFRLDNETASTPKKALEIIGKFNETPGSVLLGTEMALFYLNEKVNNSLIISMDSLFSIPDFRINEKILNLLLSIKLISRKNFIIQTRNIDESIFKYITNVNLLDFYRDEIKQRKTFGYPPFKTFIKISLSGKKEDLNKKIKKIENFLSDYEPDSFPSLIPKTKGLYKMNVLLRIPKKMWSLGMNSKKVIIDSELLSKLLSLPPSHKVTVDPEDLF